MVDGWRHLCAEIYCLNSKSSAAPSMSRRSSLRNCSFISLLSKRPLIWNALLSEGFSPNIGGSKGTLLGLGRVPMGCKCLTISLGSVRSNCAGGSLVCATSWADLDLLATGARFFTVAAGLLSVTTGVAASTVPTLHRLNRPTTTASRKIDVISPTALTAEGHMLACCARHDKSGD